MKILERKEKPTIIVTCPHCGSKLELEKGDVWWYTDIDGDKSPYVTCGACRKGIDVTAFIVFCGYGIQDR